MIRQFFWVAWVCLIVWPECSAQLDSLSLDSASTDAVIDLGEGRPATRDSLQSRVIGWEEQWKEWCETAHCVSSDTSLWMVADGDIVSSGSNLDSGFIAPRMAALDVSSALDLRWNPVAHRRIVTFGSRRSYHLGSMLGRGGMYFPLFEEVLVRESLPLELKYLPVIESGLNPEARSPAGARGLWQFMYYTAKAEGLRIDSYIDERKDPLLATEAACRHLLRLYEMYDDWYFALAAYNAGPGNVNKAIRRSGGKSNYWEVRPFLPKETRDYVPNFIAVVYLMEHHADHGIFPHKTLPGAMSIDTLMVEGPIRFDQMAAHSSLSEEEIAVLNPMYRLSIVPGPGAKFPVRWPVENVAEFLTNESSMRNHNPERTPTIIYEPEPVVYRVKSGDVLGSIALKHGVKVSQIMAWNELNSSVIRVGQKLIIHADPSKL